MLKHHAAVTVSRCECARGTSQDSTLRQVAELTAAKMQFGHMLILSDNFPVSRERQDDQAAATAFRIGYLRLPNRDRAPIP